MSIDLVRIRSGLYNWLKEELRDTAIGPDKIVWFNQDAPRPSRPYVALDLTSGPSQVGHDELRNVSDGVLDVTGNRRITVTVAVYGEDSDLYAMRLHSSLEKPTVQAALYGYGLSLNRQEDVQDVTTRLETRYETRYQFDAIFNCVSSVRDEVGHIEEVQITDEINDSTEIIG